MSKWLILGMIILSPFCTVFSQTIAIDSGYTYREVVPTICDAPDHLCHYYKMVSFNDIQVLEFTLRRINDGVGVVQGFMNFRVLFPNGFNRKDTVTKYPGIVMLHGAGEAGRSWQGHFEYFPENVEYDNNSKNINHLGEKHIEAVNKNPSLPSSFPGFVIWPQNHHSGAWEGGWNGGAMSQDMIDVATFVEYFIAEYNLNPDRIALHGLSNGAKGVWDLASKRSDLFSGILPFSGVPRDYEPQSDVLVTTPVWLFQGGLDTNPSPGSARQIIDLLIEKGGNPRYTLYPNLGHGTWQTAVLEPDFFPWIKSNDKKNIYVFGGEAVICEGGALKLGFSAGYLAYQWTYNGVDIPGATTRYHSATQLGTYTVKFQRRTTNQWDESYPTEVTLKAESTYTPVMTNIGSTTLPIAGPVLGGVSNNVVLRAPLGFTQYFWYRNGLPYDDSQVNTRNVSFGVGASGDEGVYTVRVLEASGCESQPSNPITVTYLSPQPTTLLPRPVSTTLSPTEVGLTWADVGNESAYEVWQFRRIGDPYGVGQPWSRVAILPANTTSYICKSLRPTGQYQFRIRAISGATGTFSQPSTTGFLVMPDDIVPPTAPSDLIVTGVTESTVSIAWAPSVDNDVIHRYRVYIGADSITQLTNDTSGDQTDGNPSPPTTYTFTGLFPATTYFVNVRAVDFRGNVSPFAEGAVATTTGIISGVAYKYYEFPGTMPGTANQQLAQFNFDQAPAETGTVSGFNISVRNREDQFVVAFEGYIQINTSGAHRFYTRSDDGSRLYLKTNPADPWTQVIDNDGAQSATTVSNTFNFPAAGKYPIRVTYFEQGGGNELTVKYNAGTTNNYDNAINLTNSNSVLFLSGANIFTYYSKSGGGNLSDLNNWGTNTNGNGTQPPNFSSADQHFIIANRSTVNHTSTWTVSGNGSRVVVGNGITLNLSAPLNAMIEAQDNAIINVNNTTIPTFGLLSATSTVNFNVTGTVPNGSYGNLNLNTGSTTKTFPLSTVIVKGQLSAQNGVTLLGSSPNLSVISVQRDIMLNGTSGNPPAQDSKYSFAFSGGINHTIFLNNADLNVYSLSAGVGDIVNINNNSPTPATFTLAGGNLILKDGSVLNIGTGNVSITGVAAINPNAETGVIAMNGGNFSFQSTASQNSSVYFDETQNTLNNFTYSAPTNTILSLGSPVKVKNLVTLPGGQLNASGGNLTLISNATGTARIGPLGTNAKIVGEVNFQRYMQGEGRIYRYLSSPVKGATVADLQEYIPVTGNFTGKSVIPGANPSMYQYLLPNVLDQGWKPFPTTTNMDTLRTGRGYSVFVREDVNPTTWELTGTPNQGNITFQLTPDSNTGNSTDGWNLLGNPYASPIEWTGGTSAGKWAAQGIGGVVYVRENSGTTFAWRTWNGSTGNLEDGIIAPGQAFWVQTNSATPSLTISEGAKHTSDGAFHRTAESFTNALEITVTNGTLTDQTYIQSTLTGSDFYDKAEDAVKQPNSYFNLSSKSSDNILLAINVVSDDFCEKSVSLNIGNAVAGNYTINFDGLANFYDGLVAALRDNYLGTEQNLSDGFSYNFSITSDPSTKGARFVVIMNKPAVRKDLQITSTSACESDAIIKVANAQPGVQYQMFKGNEIVSEIAELNGADFVELAVDRDALGFGSTDLVVKAGFPGCETLSIDHVVTVAIDTLAQPEISLSENDNLIASVSNAESYKWYFNGEFIKEETGREMVPAEVGAYSVEVTLGSCTKESEVFNYLNTGIEEQPWHRVSIYPNPFDDQITVYLGGYRPGEIVLHDMIGRVLHQRAVKPAEEQVSIDVRSLVSGVYILKVGSAQYKIIKKN